MSEIIKSGLSATAKALLIAGLLAAGVSFLVLPSGDIVIYQPDVVSDTLRVAEDVTIIKDGAKNIATFQRGQNYRDPLTEIFKKRDLRFKAKKDGDFDYEVRDNLIRKLNNGLSKFSVEDAEGNFVEYEAIGVSVSLAVLDNNKATASIWKDTDVELIATDLGIKENIILKTRGAPLSFRYTVNTNLSWSIVTNVIRYEDKFESVLFATDADGEAVTVALTALGNTITIEVDTVGATYPIVIDPTLEIQPDASAGLDASIDSTSNTGNTGAATLLDINGSGGGAAHQRTLIKFDISDLPVTSFIDSATLYFVYRDTDNTFTDTIDVHVLTRGFTEGTSTNFSVGGIVSWDSASTSSDNGGASDSTWTTAGGDFNATSVSNWVLTSVASDKGDSIGFTGLGSTVQDWHDGTVSNLGLLLKLRTETKNSSPGLRWYSSDWSVAAQRPYFLIYYTSTFTIDSLRFRATTDTSTIAYIDTTAKDHAFPDSFRIYLSADTSTLYGVVASADTNITSGLDTLTKNTLYSFIVTGMYAGNDSVYSPVATVRTLQEAPTAIGAYKEWGAKSLILRGIVMPDSNYQTVIYDSTNSVYIDSTGDSSTVYRSAPNTEYGDSLIISHLLIDTNETIKIGIATANADSDLHWLGAGESATTTSRIDSMYPAYPTTGANTSLLIYVGDTSSVRVDSQYVIYDWGDSLTTQSVDSFLSTNLATLTITGLSANTPHIFTVARKDSGGTTQRYFESFLSTYDSTLIASMDSSYFKNNVINVSDSFNQVPDISTLVFSFDGLEVDLADTIFIYAHIWDSVSNLREARTLYAIADNNEDSLFVYNAQYLLLIDSIDATRVDSTAHLDLNAIWQVAVWTDPTAPTLLINTNVGDTARVFDIQETNLDCTYYAVYDSLRSSTVYVGESDWQQYPYWKTATDWRTDTLTYFSTTVSGGRKFKVAVSSGLTKPDSTASITIVQKDENDVEQASVIMLLYAKNEYKPPVAPQRKRIILGKEAKSEKIRNIRAGLIITAIIVLIIILQLIVRAKRRGEW